MKWHGFENEMVEADFAKIEERIAVATDIIGVLFRHSGEINQIRQNFGDEVPHDSEAHSLLETRNFRVYPLSNNLAFALNFACLTVELLQFN